MTSSSSSSSSSEEQPEEAPSVFLYAKEKAKTPNWYGWKWEALDNDYHLVTGSVCEHYKRGPKKGKPNYRKSDKKTLKKIVFSDHDYKQWLLEWEKKNKKCYKCCGTGQSWKRWSKDKGMEYTECSRCSGSGYPELDRRR